MPFPTVEGVSGAQASLTTNLSVPLPTPGGGILADDILLAVGGGRGNTAGFGFPAGWTEVLDAGVSTFGRAAVAYKIAAGGETGNISVTRTASNTTGCTIYCLRGASLTLAPETSSIVGGNNPPSLDPVNWGTEDTFWLACITGAVNSAPTGAPSGYSNLRSDWNTSAVGGGISTARRSNAVSSEDPGVFTTAGGNEAGFTIAVAPAAPPVQNLTDGGAIATAEAFGVGTISLTTQVLTAGGAIATAQAFGVGSVSSPDMTGGGGIPSAQVFGVGLLSYLQDLTNGGGLASAQAIGGVAVSNPLTNGGGIASAEQVDGGRLGIGLRDGGAIASAQAIGVGSVYLPINLTDGGSIPSAGAIAGGSIGAGTLAIPPPYGSVQYLRWLKDRQDSSDERILT